MITKFDAGNRLAIEIKDLEKEIDTWILKFYRGSKITVSVTSDPSRATQEKILQNYRNAGWTAKFTRDNDGSGRLWLELS